MTELETHLTIARNAMAVGDGQTAEGALVQVLTRDRESFEALTNIGALFAQSGRLPAAILATERATRIKPDSLHAWNNLGYFQGIAGNWSACKESLLRSLAIGPSFEAWFHLGLCQHMRGEFVLAIAAYDEALKLQPGNPEAIDKRGLALLGAGRYVEGLIDNKMRWQVLAVHPMMKAGIPEWHGEPLDGKTIMVLHEQGAGDTFQFVRFVPALRARGARVVLSVPSAMRDLLQHSALADEVVGIQELPASGKPDFVCPMMTVPAHVGIRLDALPPCPYLKAPLTKPPAIYNRGKLKVGLVWAGKPMYADDQWRSIPLAQLLPALDVPGADFYALQVEQRRSDLAATGAHAFVTDLGGAITTWADTADLLTELDVLVTVDTAPLHLAGALGLPVFALLAQASCWRWHDHDRAGTPWYPSARLFRQAQQGDWAPVVADVKGALYGLSVRARA